MEKDVKRCVSIIEAAMKSFARPFLDEIKNHLTEDETKEIEEAISRFRLDVGYDRDEVIKNLNELIAIQKNEIAELKSNEAAIKETKRLEDIGVK